MRRKEAVLFLKKKNQKNFYHLACVGFEERVLAPDDAPADKSFFASFFSKKEDASLPCQ
jgi:hypothetical protein